jgi:hypothetical protein
MGSTIYKRRSINLDDETYKRGRVLAKSQTVSLSALLRLLINGTYEQCPDIIQQQDVIKGKWGTDHRLKSRGGGQTVSPNGGLFIIASVGFSPWGLEIIPPDAKDVHRLSINTVEYEPINTYDLSADSEQSLL